MKLRIAISHLLAALAVLGLLIAPLTSPLVAIAAEVDMGDQMTMATAAAASMPADMPCCPDEIPVPDCANDCPLTAICMSNMLQTTSESSLDLPLRFVGVTLPGSDAGLAGLRHGPPPRPPNT
jgi:hypothetical protein